MRVDDFDFDLPEANIAIRPAEPRDSAKLLLVNAKGQPPLADGHIIDLLDQLRSGDALVFNDTKVIPASLEGTRKRGDAVASVGATLHMRMAADTWRAFVRRSKKLKVGETVVFGSGTLTALVVEKFDAGEVEFQFNRSGPDLDTALMVEGNIPLPPYIASKRQHDAQDSVDYQTVYAEHNGAVAAPTAGLHFTDELLSALKGKGVELHFVTLHVGAGTFLPVKVDDTADHKMHSEIGYISSQTAAALNNIRAKGGRIVSVGTTSLRLLESAATPNGLSSWSGSTDIFITPGYKFKFVDALMTNFHLPRSTLFMLVSAFAGTAEMRNAYKHAISNGYRFYSYGDSSLLFPKQVQHSSN